MTLEPQLRPATPADVESVNRLTARSIRTLHAESYSPAVIAEAIDHAYGVDWQLVRDGTYYVAEVDGAIAGAGGWSFRRTIAGAHGPDDPAAALLDPGADAARIRAFYIDPAYARRGIGAAILDLSEHASRRAGFDRAELTATLPAVPFYSARGYIRLRPYDMPLPSGAILSLVLMSKALHNDTVHPRHPFTR